MFELHRCCASYMLLKLNLEMRTSELSAKYTVHPYMLQNDIEYVLILCTTQTSCGGMDFFLRNGMMRERVCDIEETFSSAVCSPAQRSSFYGIKF